MHYRKKFHPKLYINTGVTIIKLIKSTLTTYTIRTKLKTIFRILTVQKIVFCLLFLNIYCCSIICQIKCPLWQSVECSTRAFVFALLCRFWNLWQSLIFALYCICSIPWFPSCLQVLCRHRTHLKIRAQKRHWSFQIVFLLFCNVRLLCNHQHISVTVCFFSPSSMGRSTVALLQANYFQPYLVVLWEMRPKPSIRLEGGVVAKKNNSIARDSEYT